MSQPEHTNIPHFVGHSHMHQQTDIRSDLEYSGVNDIDRRMASLEDESSLTEEELFEETWTWQREVLDEEWLEDAKAIIKPAFMGQCKKYPNVTRGLSQEFKGRIRMRALTNAWFGQI